MLLNSGQCSHIGMSTYLPHENLKKCRPIVQVDHMLTAWNLYAVEAAI